MPNFWETLPKPFLILAPMEGVTDYVFREIIAEIGKPHVLFTEFTSTDSMTSEKGFPNSITRFDFSEKQRPLVAQIWGTKPENYFKTAQIISKLKFDGIDINTGCPDRAVVKNGSGAALIKNPSLLAELVQATREGAPELPLSIKTRLGFEKKITEEWISYLLRLDINALTIHGRTAAEESKVPADWNEIAKCVNLKNQINPEIKIIGNGDVKGYNDAFQKYEEYKVDGIMVGRGIFHNPFFFSENKNPSTADLINLLLKHTELYEKHWNNRKNFAEMRRFFKIYVKEFRNAARVKDDLMKAENFAEVKEIIKAHKQLINSTSQ